MKYEAHLAVGPEERAIITTRRMRLQAHRERLHTALHFRTTESACTLLRISGPRIAPAPCSAFQDHGERLHPAPHFRTTESACTLLRISGPRRAPAPCSAFQDHG
ncbi:hypothetical protein NHX12_026555 [Muraenolepis orangiensis]|uniref:Uncharacterized protein n=1 Tax=Muraenolepis orangiensis TaxID=630683 RepID=A0A9Q0EKE8_9TELE|nr:hypothetical protein NHX12_026555 [Muraenolepis orangiensis]